MSLAQQKLNLLKKIVDARLTKEEMQELLNKAQEIAQRRSNAERKMQS